MLLLRSALSITFAQWARFFAGLSQRVAVKESEWRRVLGQLPKNPLN